MLSVAHDREAIALLVKIFGVGYVTEDGMQDRVPLGDAWAVRFAFRGSAGSAFDEASGQVAAYRW